MSEEIASQPVKVRTKDVKHQGVLTFEDLMISPPVLSGLREAAFVHPSPIQLKAIPLGRCGLDLIVQAKSGTGKTCVFSVISLESIALNSPSLQVLILSPTREIAVQSQRVICTIGSRMQGLGCHTFIGGIHRSEDLKNLKNCHIAVGSPGRIKYLIEEGYMKTKSIRLLVLDEVDMLMTDAFQPTINWIFSALPLNKQMVAVSATYTESMVHHLTNYMKNPTFVRLNTSDPALLGIRQFYHLVPNHHLQHVIFQSKLAILVQILSTVDFQQCLVFSNFHSRTQDLCEALTQKGWPVTYISGSLDQTQRIQAYDQLTQFQCRVLVSTDLTARGIDAQNVNMVINLDIPWEMETYLHRIGRAGRFGSFGAAISLVSAGDELALLQRHEKACKTTIHNLPIDPIPKDIAQPSCPELDLEKLVSVQHLSSTPDGKASFKGIQRARPRRDRTERSTRPSEPNERSTRSSEPENTGDSSEINGNGEIVDDRPEATVNCTVEKNGDVAKPEERPKKRYETEEAVAHIMALRSSLKQVQNQNQGVKCERLTLSDVQRRLANLSLDNTIQRKETVTINQELDTVVRDHLEKEQFFGLGRKWVSEKMENTKEMETDSVGIQCQLEDRSIEPVVCQNSNVNYPEQKLEESEDEEDSEETEESDSEVDSELEFLQQEYNRLGQWAQYYSSEYEKACADYEYFQQQNEGSDGEEDEEYEEDDDYYEDEEEEEEEYDEEENDDSEEEEVEEEMEEDRTQVWVRDNHPWRKAMAKLDGNM